MKTETSNDLLSLRQLPPLQRLWLSVPRLIRTTTALRPTDLPRLAGYAVMAFVAWLLLSTLFRPWVSSSATRAVLNAPAILITSPIEGTVTGLTTQGGMDVQDGQVLAVVKNSTVSRDTLTQLLTRQLDMQGRADDLGARLAADERMLEQVDAQYQRYLGANAAQLRSVHAAALARQQMAQSKVSELNTRAWRMTALQRDGAVSADTVAATQAQLEAARSAADAAAQEVRSSSIGINAAAERVFLGASDNGLLAQLAQRRDDLQFGIARGKQELASLQQQLGRLDALVESERQRVAQLSDYAIRAHGAGTVQEVVTPVGTQVRAGATLVRATDCSKAGVVAVFPARMADRLNRGSQLKVRVDGLDASLKARVEQLLPKVSDGLQSAYSVPFPYAEDGSVYALAQWDGKLSPQAQGALCTPGRSVSAELI